MSNVTEWLKSGHATNWEILSYLNRCIDWVKQNTICSGGIAVSDKQEIVHTKITEGLVPVLETLGEKDLAQQYKKYLKKIPEGGIFDGDVGPKNVNEALTLVKFEESSYLRALAMRFLLDDASENYYDSMVDKALMKDLEGMDKSGVLMDKTIHRILPAGLCLYAIVCYRLGHYRRGDKLLQTVCALQRKSGGWFGSSHGQKQFDYFNDEEVCWTNLHFLEAVIEYDRVQRKAIPDIVLQNLEIPVIHRIKKNLKLDEDSHTLVICSERWKGRLGKELPGTVSYWSDLALNMAHHKANEFDAVVSIVSMSDSLRPKKMIKELFRVCKPEGNVIIIDKNIEKLKYFKLFPNEQWFDANEINTEMIKYGDTHHSYFKMYNVPELYIIWRGMKRNGGVK